MPDITQNQPSPPRPRNWRLALGVVAGFAMLWVVLGNSFNQPTRTPLRYLFPEGFVGKYRIDLGVASAPPLPLEDGFMIVRFPASGRIRTSSMLQDGWANDEFYYVSADGQRKQLPLNEENSIVQEQSISQGQNVSAAGKTYTEPLRLEGFIGTTEQHKKFYGY